ncbi:hypothetical protein GCK32_008132 [Trichostrongylus colubriformis]|uniref:Uncharacterized protein n=1 Tax=Trichostrongylus colubriformis TaxID=6319 RepID=A0AAN8F052_TRICO
MVVLRKRFKLTSRAFAPSMTKTQSQKIMRSNVTMGMTTLSAVLLLLIPDVMLHFSWPIQDSSGKLFLYLLILNKVRIKFPLSVIFIYLHYFTCARTTVIFTLCEVLLSTIYHPYLAYRRSVDVRVEQ